MMKGTDFFIDSARLTLEHMYIPSFWGINKCLPLLGSIRRLWAWFVHFQRAYRVSFLCSDTYLLNVEQDTLISFYRLQGGEIGVASVEGAGSMSSHPCCFILLIDLLQAHSHFTSELERRTLSLITHQP